MSWGAEVNIKRDRRFGRPRFADHEGANMVSVYALQRISALSRPLKYLSA
jgi:hypothetical protein